ncbi:MAG: hypothetical protein Fur0043_23710 [Anaerolineales bacterium]
MKTLGRILVILLAATVVVGATWSLTHRAKSESTFPAPAQFRPRESFSGEEFAPGGHPEGLREGGFEREHGAFRLFGWIKNVGLIAVIVTVIVFLEHVWDKKRISHFALSKEEQP